jgi:hypothetical protein
MTPPISVSEAKGKRVVIEGLAGIPLDLYAAEIIGRIVAEALSEEGWTGHIQVILEDFNG